MAEKLWFKAKKFGWGWTPASWEGWAATGIYLALVYAASMKACDFPILFAVSLIAASCLYVWICLKKGEKARWHG